MDVIHPKVSWADNRKDLGKVLAGIQVPPVDFRAFDIFLQKLNFTYVEETGNVVYKRFLQG